MSSDYKASGVIPESGQNQETKRASVDEETRGTVRDWAFGILSRETPRQAGMLFSAQTGSMAASLLVSVVQARWMEPTELGRFAFCLATLLLAGIFFEVGIFAAGARVLALARDSTEASRILAALVLLAIMLGLVYSAFVAGVSGLVDSIFKTDVKRVLLYAAAFAFFQPFNFLIEQSCQGLNQIRRLSAFQLLSSGSYMLLIVGLAFAGGLSAQTALVAYLVGIGIAATWTIILLHPQFKGSWQYIRPTLHEAKNYGFNLYIARITASASSRVDNLVIGYFLGRSSFGLAPLGLYAFGQKMASPMITMSRALAITRFRAFAKATQIPNRISRWNGAALVSMAIGLILVGPYVLRYAFPKYEGAAPLLVPLALLGMFAGLFQPYNMFLASHGRGAEIRNIAIAVSVASLVGLFLLVPRFGALGAAWSGAVAMALDYALYVYYYRRFKESLDSVPHKNGATA
jgi:O-antigen/teichoic acid export membrane protein